MRTLSTLAIMGVLLVIAACGKEESRTPPPQPTSPVSAREHTLTYIAGENGALDGAVRQVVEHGGAGSAVTAVPAAGYHFTQWSDGSTANPRTDAGVQADITVTASFARNQYTLAYTAAENGSIDGAARQVVEHGASGSPVSAVPAPGYHFAGWSDGVETASRTDTGVTADLAVTADFAIDTYNLTYSAGENGTLDGAARQVVAHGGAGSPVTAVPAPGYHFVKWSDGSTANPRTDLKVTADLAVTAGFARNQYTLSYSATEHGSIDGAGTQTVSHGGAGSPVTAVAEKGYHFVRWSDGVTSASRTERNVTGDISVSAAFAVDTFTVGGSVSGLVEGTRLVLQNNGDDLTLTANGRFSFATALPTGRTYAATVLTQPASPNQTCMVAGGSGRITGENVTGIAVTCVLNTYTVGGTVSGLAEGDRLVLRNNKEDELTVGADGSFTFAKALGDGSGYAVAVHSSQLKPNWTCRVDNGKGTLAGRDVTDVSVACFPQAELQTAVGIGKINLKWNSQDFKGAVFNLCRAREEIPKDSFGRCQELEGGFLQAKVASPQTFSRPAYDVPYWFQLEVQHPGGQRSWSKVVSATVLSSLNDTGIDWCADNGRNQKKDGSRDEKAAGCQAVATSHPGQDGQQGRDVAARSRKLTKAGGGSAGFDFTRVCMNGEAAGEGKCPPNPAPGSGATNWSCTLDNTTGLLWEVKADSGMRSQDHTYTWFNPDKTVNGGAAGVENGGSCSGSRCDTHAYVQAVNAGRLCGTSDWRLPTRKELLSIVDNGRLNPAIDTGYFPNSPPAYYWTGSPYSDQSNSAWQVYFRYGEASAGEKRQGNHVRLVRKAR